VRTAVIDLGSNTFHLLVADVDRIGIRREIIDHKIAIRFDPARPAAAHAALEDLIVRCGGYIEDCRVVATGVFREHGAQFLAEASARTGVPIECIDGAEEARLTWLAVSAELAGSHAKLAVIDLGGGSLELAIGTSTVDGWYSFPVGVLRLRGLPDIAARVTAETRTAMQDLRALHPDTVAVTSGTARALLRIARRLGLVADGQRHMWRRTLAELARWLPTVSHEKLLAKGVSRERVDTIATGAIALHAVVEQLEKPVVFVARTALREGILIDQARSQAACDAAAWNMSSMNGR